MFFHNQSLSLHRVWIQIQSPSLLQQNEKLQILTNYHNFLQVCEFNLEICLQNLFQLCIFHENKYQRHPLYLKLMNLYEIMLNLIIYELDQLLLDQDPALHTLERNCSLFRFKKIRPNCFNNYHCWRAIFLLWIDYAPV